MHTARFDYEHSHLGVAGAMSFTNHSHADNDHEYVPSVPSYLFCFPRIATKVSTALHGLRHAHMPPSARGSRSARLPVVYALKYCPGVRRI